MYFVILIMISLISTRKTDRIKRIFPAPRYRKPSGYDYCCGTIVWDDYNYDDFSGDYQGEIGPTIIGDSCNFDSYEIIIRMGSVLFSGTDDKVEIRLYGINGEISEWLGLTESLLIDGIDGFERLSEDTYCVKTEKDFKTEEIITKVGIRKFGTDRMMIDTISISHGEFGSFFLIDQWIKEEKQEFIFEAFSWF